MALSITATFRCDYCPGHASIGLLVLPRPERSDVLATATVAHAHLPEGWREHRGKLICWRCGQERRGGMLARSAKPVAEDPSAGGELVRDGERRG